MEEMEYLKLQTRHLKTIKLKRFDFPELCSYVDSNRYSDDDPDFSVWFYVPGDRASHYLYSSSNRSEWDAVRAEIREWNSNPKKHWKRALKVAHEHKIEIDQYSIRVHKKSIKSALKALKKLVELG